MFEETTQPDAEPVIDPVAPKCDICSIRREEVGNDDKAAFRLVSVFTGGIANERFDRAMKVSQDSTLTTNEKLTKIDSVMPFPATASAEQLGRMLGVTKQAVLKTEWWTQHRKGEKADEVGRRHDLHKRRASQCEPNGQTDEDD